MSPNCYFSGGEVRCNCTETNMQIEGGHYRLTKHLRAGSMLVYNCPEGYYPYPARTRLCQPNGSWRPAPKRFSPQRCRREWYEADGSHFASGCLLHTVTQILLFCFAVVECPDPSVLEYGNVSPPQEKYYVDNETTYECYSGYTMRGSSSRVCLPSGKWSGSTPICSRDCKTRTAIWPLCPLSLWQYTLTHLCFMTFVLFIWQQEIIVLILVSQLVPREWETCLELTTQWDTAAMATSFWWGRTKGCVRRTASGVAMSQRATVRLIPTNPAYILCHVIRALLI